MEDELVCIAQDHEDVDRAGRYITVIFTAFRLGFVSHVLSCHKNFWKPKVVRELLDRFAPELNPNSFESLKSKLGSIQKQHRRLFRNADADAVLESYGTSWSESDLPDDIQRRELANRVLRWIDDCREFAYLTRQAVPESSWYRTWFVCGRWLGECRAQATRGQRFWERGRADPNGNVNHLQMSIRKLPRCFGCTPWLKALSNFDFRKADPSKWIESVPADCGEERNAGDASQVADSEGGLAKGPALTDLQSLFDHIYWRFLVSLRRSVVAVPFEYHRLVPGAPPAYTLSPMRLKAAESALGTGSHVPKPLAIEVEADDPTAGWGKGPRWDAKRHQFLFDGVIVYTYRRKAKNQFLVLEAFEADSWQPVIDTPIDDTKKRTQTLKELNEIAPDKITFRGDGTGECIRWERPSRTHPKKPAGRKSRSSHT